MILVTVGTNEQPFDRLVDAAAGLDVAEPVVVQHGSAATRGTDDWFDFLSFERMVELMEEARAVVCHAGVGSIMLACRHGKRPLVVPRRLHLGEAVDDHQLALARRLDGIGVVRLVEDESTLGRAVAGAERAVEPLRLSDDLRLERQALATDVRRCLETIVARSGTTAGAPVAGRG